MAYKQMWEVIDANGTIHSGDEKEMRTAYDAMTQSKEYLVQHYGTGYTKDLIEKWKTEWKGDLKLIQIHELHN